MHGHRDWNGNEMQWNGRVVEDIPVGVKCLEGVDGLVAGHERQNQGLMQASSTERQAN